MKAIALLNIIILVAQDEWAFEEIADSDHRVCGEFSSAFPYYNARWPGISSPARWPS
jgi:hypothetical protein